ncbi:metalloendoproteinase 4-MMP [Cajanus cajan]|uniref:Metalloendoproteinase 1 n=1 Tax=Cajanus cajan TaxID=3821 RepID=A0A151RA26_CAJCA|nr:metalloendoproteinase 4-MMP [Cajanus cajan]KYP39343.1 Metalloendoproteinase 1 [Cajanus cajan]
MFLSLRYSFTFLFTLVLISLSPSRIASTTPHDPTFTPQSTKIAITNHIVQGFTNAGRGSKISGISQFKRYLSRFGYLRNNNNTSFDDEFDAKLESAIVRYQRNLGLQVTGKLDSNTVSQMITPRCGDPDTNTTPHNHNHHHHHQNHNHVTKNFVFFPGKPRWSRPMPMTLSYAFSRENMIHSLSIKEIREAFQRAFLRWASVIPVSFVEVDDFDLAEIKIGFYNGEHGDGEPFDGVLGVLAHSFSPEIGRLHLDAAETWAVDFRATASEVAVDLESVATHEIGHLLGLSHSSVKEAVMYPSLRPRGKRADLNIDDIKGVQSLYGSNPNFRSEWSLESDMSANQGAEFGVKPFSLATSLIIIIIVLIHILCS